MFLKENQAHIVKGNLFNQNTTAKPRRGWSHEPDLLFILTRLDMPSQQLTTTRMCPKQGHPVTAGAPCRHYWAVGLVQNPRSEWHQKSPVTFSIAPWPTHGMVWWGQCCMWSSCRLRSDTGIIQPCTISINMDNDVWWIKALYSLV